MAFGNATIGDLKKIAGGGGGGGGTKDYTELTNKPSINGVELLAGTEIGKLSGNIKVTLSALDNVNLTSPTDAQALLFDSLTSKWKNGSVSGITIDSVQVTNNSCTFNVDGVKAIIIEGSYLNSYNNITLKNTTFLVPADLDAVSYHEVVADSGKYLTIQSSINQNQVTLSREYDGGLTFSKCYLIK